MAIKSTASGTNRFGSTWLACSSRKKMHSSTGLLDKLVLNFGKDWWEEPLRFYIAEVDADAFDSFMARLFDAEVIATLNQKQQDLLVTLITEARQTTTEALQLWGKPEKSNATMHRSGQDGVIKESRVCYFFGVMADVMAAVTAVPKLSKNFVAVLTELVATVPARLSELVATDPARVSELVAAVPARLMPDCTAEFAVEMPLATVSVTASATFWIGAPTAIRRLVKTPLFSFAIVVCV